MKKKYIIISIMLSFVILLTGTYAWLTWQSTDNTNFTFSLGEIGEVIFSGGNAITTSGMGPVLTIEEGFYTEFQILKKTDAEFSVTIDFLPTVLPDELKEESFKYVLLSKKSKNSTYSVVMDGTFENKTQGTQFTIIEEEIINTTYYKLVIYIDGNMANPSDMQGKSLEGKVIVNYSESKLVLDMENISVVSTYETGKEETFVVPMTGTYKLEVWGAQGGDATSSTGGYGAYSTGLITLEENDALFINVGGAGTTTSSEIIEGGYNGGGSAKYSSVSGNRGSGGGATSITFKSGLLKNLSPDTDLESLIIIASGGGGAAYYSSDQVGNGGAGGGIVGNDGGAGSGTPGTGGTQLAGGTGFNAGSFGLGGSYGDDSSWGGAGGGGGYYGGGGAWNNSGAGGGSSYIGNSLLTNKYMYCYKCQTSDEESTKTYTTDNVSESAIADYAKQGNGYAKITLLIPQVSNLNKKVLNLGENFDVTSDVTCLDVGTGCEIVETKIIDSNEQEYSSTIEITLEGAYTIKYIIQDNENNEYIYYRPLKVINAFDITSVYNEATKTFVSNNGINYEYAPDLSLMKDVNGNLRYYGATPKNYVYFNCTNYSNQTSSTCEVWRIIGIFNGKLKIIRDSAIGSYSWDASGGTYGANDWTKADLMKLLNPEYETNRGTNTSASSTFLVNNSLYYNAQSGTCYQGESGDQKKTVSCSFTSTGIKNDDTRNMISDSLFYLGGHNSVAIYPDQMLGYEQGNNVYGGRDTTWTGKIALMYPSDYGYAVDLSKCNQTLEYYNESVCTQNNWLHKTQYRWTLTPTVKDSTTLYSKLYYIFDTGRVWTNYWQAYADAYIYPTLFLKEEISLVKGTGISTDPYHLDIP